MPIAPCLGSLLLAFASAQQPTSLASATPAVTSVAAVDVMHASARLGSTPGPNEPAKPKEQEFGVPEAQTLLIVGAGLVLVALAKRRVRIAPVVRS